MAITKWDPTPDLIAFRDQMSDLWGWPFVGPSRRGTFVPAVDVYDTKDALVVQAELAGMKPEDIEIEVDDDVLTIKGERKQEESSDEHGHQRVERRYGAFERRITLPKGTKADDIEAACEDGVLTVRVPRAEVKNPERVEIKATSGKGHEKSKAAKG
ncbi:MAG TPA: Hsp20/alpha crystallin family protein [Thermoleophilia bacterium]|nr:Hsp20/alpha crystallin family protein [Thermoleophilia bacterium]